MHDSDYEINRARVAQHLRAPQRDTSKLAACHDDIIHLMIDAVNIT